VIFGNISAECMHQRFRVDSPFGDKWERSRSVKDKSLLFYKSTEYPTVAPNMIGTTLSKRKCCM